MKTVPKKQLGPGSLQKRPRRTYFAICCGKCPKYVSRRGSRGGPANQLLATFCGLVSYWLSRGALDRPNGPQRCQNEPRERQNELPGGTKPSHRRCHGPYHFFKLGLLLGLRVEGTVAGRPQAIRYLSMYLFIYLCIYVYIYTMYIYTYIYIYIYIHMHLSLSLYIYI